jgi:hypothetical protein
MEVRVFDDLTESGFNLGFEDQSVWNSVFNLLLLGVFVTL